MANVLERRLDTTCKEASLLISNPPTKDIALEQSNLVNDSLLENEKLEILQDHIRTFSKSSALHFGITQGTGKSKSTCTFPEPLLCILWLHRWAIADENTLENFKLLLRPDITFKWDQRTVKDFYNPTWIRQNIINHVMRTVNLLVVKKRNEHATRYINYHKMSSRLQAVLTHNITTDIVEALLKYGPDPVCLPNATNSQSERVLNEIADRLRKNVDILKKMNRTKNTFLPTTFTELILAAIPRFFELSFAGEDNFTMHLYDDFLVDHPTQQEIKKTAWEPDTTWDKFKIRIPLVKKTANKVDTTPARQRAKKSAPEVGGVKKKPCSVDKLFELVLIGELDTIYLFDESTTESTRTPVKEKTSNKEETPTKGKANKKLAKEKVTQIKTVLELVDQPRIRESLIAHMNDLCTFVGLD